MPFDFLFSVRVAKNPQLYFARRLNEAMKGAGTDEDTIIRIVVCRSEVTNGHRLSESVRIVLCSIKDTK